MTCPEVVSRLDDLVDGGLPSVEADQLRDHITACRSCREEFDMTRRVKYLLGSATTPDPGDDYFAESESHILARTIQAGGPEAHRSSNADDTRDARRTALVRALLSVAASLAILFVAIYLGSNRELLITRTVDPSAPVIATADVRPSLGGHPVFTAEDRLRITRGMMLIGSPGILGRFSTLPEILKTHTPDES